MIKNSINTILFFSTFLYGCASVDHKPNINIGENLITPYSGDLAGWTVHVENNAHIHSRMWQHPEAGFANSYVVTVSKSSNQEVKSYRTILDQPGVASCATFTSQTIASENHYYPKEFWATTCEKENGYQVKALHLILKGKDSFYHLQKIWQGTYQSENVEIWLEKLAKTYICDTRIQEQQCPLVPAS